ncbi:S-layer homology domain-containing protein [Gorillibacterium sp. sgz500922]|uniref:S-layer homology domain-containing protein n=1 Tax=Gorillibacterium sp. sgz500922 TaxID=3446694 RepID=UPI003F666589
MKNSTRKIVSTSLVASLLATSLAGLPLSSKGLLEHLGAGKAYAAESTSPLKKRLKEIHNEMTEKERQSIRTARYNVDKSNLDDTISFVWAKITSKYPNADPALRDQLRDLTKSLLLYYDTEVSAVDKLKTEFSSLFKTLANYTKQPVPSVEDGSDFATELESTLRNSIKGADTADWTAYLLAHKDAIVATEKVAFEGSKTKTAAVLKSYGIGSSDLMITIIMANSEVSGLSEAEHAFINAYTRLLAKENATSNPGTVVVPAAPSNFDSSSAKAALESLTPKLADLLKEGSSNQGVKSAVAALQELVRTQAVVDLSSSVKVNGDTAKATINVAGLDTLFASIQSFVKDANAALQKAAPGTKPVKAVVTLDFKTVSAKSIELPITQDLLKKASSFGIDALAFKVNGVSLAVDVDQLKSDTALTISKADQKAVADATPLVAVSDVYSFTFTADGKEIKSFAKPVEVRIPVNVTSGVNAELLSLTKIDGKKLEFKGGSYNLNTKEQVAPNKSFSTYTVLENKVTFNDIASVNAWAGKQISVAAAKGIVEGRAKGQFVPNGDVTRAEFAKMLVKALGLENEAAKESFADVKDNDWFKPYVAAAAEAGLVTGKTASTFDPNAKITRAEMATMAARAMVKVYDYKNVADVKGSLAKFGDAAKIHSTLQAGVALAAAEGIVVGDAGQFKPESSATRAEAAVIIYRLINQ